MTILQRNMSERLVCLHRKICGSVGEDSYSNSGAAGSIWQRERTICLETFASCRI